MSLLIIDDEPFNVEILEEILQDAGYRQVNGDTDSRKAIALCEQFKPDLLLLDLQMPHVSGLEVIQQIKQHKKLRNTPTLVITAQTSEQYRLQALGLGAKDYITKPFNQAEVLKRIHNLLETQHLQNDLRQNIQELEKTNHMMSELVSIVSHELRTPLTSIKSFIEILKDDDGDLDQESRTQFLDIIDNESDRLGRLISNLLDVQKIKSGKMSWKNETIDLVKTLNETVTFFTPAYQEKGLSIKLVTELDQANVLIDSDKLRQVLTNLLSNALKFTTSGGVTIHTRKTHSWANTVLMSNDPTSIRPLSEIIHDLFTSVAHLPDHEELIAHIEESGGCVDLLIYDIANNDSNNINFLEKIRSTYPALPVVTIVSEEAGFKNINKFQRNNTASIKKPINIEDSRGEIELLIADMLRISPLTPMIEIKIKDTGVGIPKKDLNKVFERFHQVDSSHTREQGGTGLGLTICNEIINHYHGRIWVESEEQQGSEFNFILPEMQQQKKRIGEVLVEQGLVTEEQLNAALKNQTS